MEFQERVRSLALKHNRKELYIKKHLSNGTQHKQRHAPSIRNAIMHDLCRKAKEGEFFVLLLFLSRAIIVSYSVFSLSLNLSLEEYLESKRT
jgi:hypothetical protein